MTATPPPVGAGGRQGRILHNAIALYAVQASAFLLPLITLPYLARVLGPDGWGVVVFAQSYSIWLALLLHYGFAFSATRSVAQHRDDAGRLAEIVQGVQSAKVVLLSAVAAIGALSWWFVPLFHEHPGHFVWAWIGAVGFGFTPLWFYQGTERLRGAAALDVGARAVATAGILLFVRNPADGWMVLALRAGADFSSTSLLTWRMYRRVAPRGLQLIPAWTTLREGWPLFVFSSAASAYTHANAFVMGLMAVPREVSFFGAGERMVRAGSTLLSPLSQAIYPRVSHLAAHDSRQAGQLIRRSLLPFVGLGLALGVALFVSAPLLTRIAFGPEYEPTVRVIRILSVIPPLLGLGTVVGIHWALPMGMDRIYMRFVLGAGALNLLLAVILVPRFGAAGMAVAAVSAELSVELGLVWLAFGSGWAFWRRAEPELSGAPAPAASRSELK